MVFHLLHVTVHLEVHFSCFSFSFIIALFVKARFFCVLCFKDDKKKRSLGVVEVYSGYIN